MEQSITQFLITLNNRINERKKSCGTSQTLASLRLKDEIEPFAKILHDECFNDSAYSKYTNKAYYASLQIGRSYPSAIVKMIECYDEVIYRDLNGWSSYSDAYFVTMRAALMAAFYNIDLGSDCIDNDVSCSMFLNDILLIGYHVEFGMWFAPSHEELALNMLADACIMLDCNIDANVPSRFTVDFVSLSKSMFFEETTNWNI